MFLLWLLLFVFSTSVFLFESVSVISRVLILVHASLSRSQAFSGDAPFAAPTTVVVVVAVEMVDAGPGSFRRSRRRHRRRDSRSSGRSSSSSRRRRRRSISVRWPVVFIVESVNRRDPTVRLVEGAGETERRLGMEPPT